MAGPAGPSLPARQGVDGVSGAHLVEFIKAWTESEGKKDLDILGAADNPQPRWPWSTAEEFRRRFAEASRWRANREEGRVRTGR